MSKTETNPATDENPSTMTGGTGGTPCFMRPDGSMAPIVLTGVAPLDSLQTSWANHRTAVISDEIRAQIDGLITISAGDAVLAKAWPDATPDFYGDCRTIASEISGVIKNEDGRTTMLRSELFFLPVTGCLAQLKQVILNEDILSRISDMITDRLTGGTPMDLCRFGVYPRLINPMAAVAMTPSFLRQMTNDMTIMVLAGGIHPDTKDISARITPFLIPQAVDPEDETTVTTVMLMFCRLRFSETAIPVRDHLYDATSDETIAAARQTFVVSLDTWLRSIGLCCIVGYPCGLDDSLALAACQMTITTFLAEANQFGHAPILPLDRISIEAAGDTLFITGSKRLQSAYETRTYPTVQRFGPARIERKMVATRRHLFDAHLQSNSFVRVTAKDIAKDIVLH